MVERKIKYEPLEQYVSFKDVRQFRRDQKVKPKKMSRLKITFMIVGILFALSILSNIMQGFTDGVNTVIFLIIIVAVVIAYQAHKYYMTYHHVRLSRFAAANNLSYTPLFRSVPQEDGLIFNIGHSHLASEILADYHETYGFEMANYSYYTGSGRNKRLHSYHYITLKLPRRLPHIVLDAKKGNFMGVSNLPIAFKNAQKLQLEGDFNKYFTLYCPKKYERDALYIFTPDIMAMMIDLGAKYDVEIIDDKLFLYGAGHMRRFDRKLYESAFTILNVFGKKMHARVDYYADERIGDRTIDAVDVAGYRLQRSRTKKIISTTITIIIIWFILWLIAG